MVEMKLYYFSNSVLPSKTADSVNVMNTCSSLSGQGTKIFTSGIEGNETGIDAFSYYGVSASFKLLCFKPIIKKGSLYISALLDVLRIKRIKPDAIYGRSIFTAVMLHRFKIQFYFECHDAKWLVNSRYDKMYSKVFTSPYLQKLVVVSEGLKALTLEKFPRFQNHPIHLIRNGASVPKVTSQRNKSKNTVGYVGGFYKGRGLKLIVDLAINMPHLTFKLAGGDTNQLAILSDNKIPNNIECLGYLKPSETAAFRQSVDILLAPYQRQTLTIGGTDSTQYMSPIKIFEYMSSCTPIVASKLPAVAEVLNSERSILAEPDNIKEWQLAIEKIMSDSEFSQRISKNAYDYFLDNLTWKSRAKKILDIIE
jgi:glycosyltransferase involved in cell wall biosynthesis